VVIGKLTDDKTVYAFGDLLDLYGRTFTIIGDGFYR
jgi:hypothetical protein